MGAVYLRVKILLPRRITKRNLDPNEAGSGSGSEADGRPRRRDVIKRKGDLGGGFIQWHWFWGIPSGRGVPLRESHTEGCAGWTTGGLSHEDQGSSTGIPGSRVRRTEVQLEEAEAKREIHKTRKEESLGEGGQLTLCDGRKLHRRAVRKGRMVW
ncbi:hypothetical protein BGW36DRAFT_430895 [Talaromyces proteolyticus]|uniref:Uncharacterized protein n=1 Tax=Talaromyces proteolyticus TaxID=1131652 RepID=A0AAD4KIF3_9EURO|nr:uncharacterized protein BGW36DRAFT_430895 [Talaromyces proteolyticus]KAH8693157.1 hypothetical protein BGW36DRAFT_430895 [Talaromyces proteolyticus]